MNEQRLCDKNQKPSKHDGRWLWIKVNGIQAVKDIERMVMIKKKPLKARS
ncbi:hypothetical protein PAE9249_02195 [Paenibacillus sp. CECT 9249]|nr:hypothetical protein PAE9249_02195 [Paenibacillus sp. CECT 9249]